MFIQVNTSGEEEKSGVEPEKAEELARHIVNECPSLRFYGVMTIGALATSQAHGENQDFKVRFMLASDWSNNNSDSCRN